MKTKRILSVLLTLIMIFTVIPMGALTADASAWDSAGYDCVAYAKARFREMWGFELHATGMTNGYYGAHGYYYNAANYGDIVSGTPKAGALAVWTSNYNVYGHVAVVESVSGGNVTYTEGGFYDENKGGNRANRATRSASAMSYSWNDSKYGYCKQTFLGMFMLKVLHLPILNRENQIYRFQKLLLVKGRILQFPGPHLLTHHHIT